MGGCALPDCDNTPGKCRLFTFPRNEARRNLWISRCYLTSVGHHARLCEAHFDESQFELRRLDGWKRLKHDAVPTLFPEPIRIFKMDIESGEPTEIIEVIEDKSRKRKSTKKDNEEEKLKKAYLDAVNLKGSAEERRSGKLNKAISTPNSKKISLLDHLDQIKKMKLNDKVESDKVATNGKIVKNAQPIAGKLNTSNSAFQSFQKKPEDLKESDEDTENSKGVKNAELDETDPSQLLALMKQWNAVLKEELVDLRQNDKTEKLKNELLLERTLELEKTIEKLKCENNANSGEKKLEKGNRMLEHDVDEMQHCKKQFELEKQAYKDWVKELQERNKKLLLQNNNMQFRIAKEHENYISVEKENHNLKCESEMLNFHMKAFKKNSQDMCKVLIELRKHNKVLNEKLVELQDRKMEELLSAKHEKELLEMQVNELKSQNGAMINENACMLEEIQEFIMSNKEMYKTITELEKHNCAISCKLKDVEEKNQSMSLKILDLETQVMNLTKDELTKLHSPQCLN